MAENVEKSIENIVKELRRLQDIEVQIAEALRKHGLTLVKTAAGYDVKNLGEITAQSQKKSPEQTDQLPSATAGMNMAERILHVGGRNNAAGYVEFGSVQAVEALVRHVIRDLPQPGIKFNEGLHQEREARLAAEPVSRQLSDAEMAEAAKRYTSPQPKNIRVYGWVWKDKHWVDDCYTPSYTPALHVSRGELFALVDPADLHEPLQNTKWF
jgi:hypothetical protein